MSTKAELTRLHTLISKLQIPEDGKRAMIAEATNGRTTSSKEMTSGEITDLCNGLQKMVPAPLPAKLVPDADKDARDVMRKKIISRAHRLGWQLQGGKIDMERVNAWCVSHGHLHLQLNSYGYNDLVKLVSQMDAMYKSYLKAV